MLLRLNLALTVSILGARAEKQITQTKVFVQPQSWTTFTILNERR